MPIRDINEGGQKNGYVEDQEILEREFGEKQESPMKNLNHYKVWSVRSGDWYNSERRMIFATRSRKERNRWLKHFKAET